MYTMKLDQLLSLGRKCIRSCGILPSYACGSLTFSAYILRTTATVKRQAWLISLPLIVFNACSRQTTDLVTVDPSTLSTEEEGRDQLFSRITAGISPAELQSALKHDPTHEFTASAETETLLCLSYLIGSNEAHYYFLFIDNQLDKIIESPPVEYEEYINYRGFKARRDKPVDPELRVEAVLEGDGLSDQAFIQSVKDHAEAYRRAIQHEEPMNVLPAFVIVSPLLAVQAPRIAADALKNAKLEKLYNPLKVSLGITTEQADALLGSPLYAEPIPDRDGQVRRVYGRNVDLAIGGRRFSWIEVRFLSDTAVAVYSHDFFDERLRQKARRSIPGHLDSE